MEQIGIGLPSGSIARGLHRSTTRPSDCAAGRAAAQQPPYLLGNDSVTDTVPPYQVSRNRCKCVITIARWRSDWWPRWLRAFGAFSCK